MNALRTIQASQDKAWVDALFLSRAPRSGPQIPPFIPFPHAVHRAQCGEFIYLVYRGAIVGYGTIADVVHHNGTWVGAVQYVRVGQALVLAGPLKPLSVQLRAVGFQGIRYTNCDLHAMPRAAAQRAVVRAIGR